MKSLYTFILTLCVLNNVIFAQCPEIIPQTFSPEFGETNFDHKTDFTFFNDTYFMDGGEKFSANYIAGIKMGGMKANSNLCFSAVDYSEHDFAPGPLSDVTGTINEEDCVNWNQFFVIKKEEIDLFLEDFEDNGMINNEIPEAIKYYPCNGNIHFSEKYGFELPDNNMGGLAPFVDQNMDGLYQPESGDYPMMEGDVQTFSIANDLSIYSENPVEMEFLSQSSFENTENLGFIKNRIKLKGIYHDSEPISDFYISFWMDGDLNCLNKNNVGSLPNHKLFYYYLREDLTCKVGNENGNTPLLLVRIEDGQQNPMSSFISSNNPAFINMPNPATIDAQAEIESYQYLQGIWRDGIPLTWGGDGYNPNSNDFYAYHYDLSENSPYGPWKECDVETEPRDARTYANFGPYYLEKGDEIELDIQFFLIKDLGLYCPDEEDIINMFNQITDNEYVSTKAVERPNMKVFPNPTTDFVTLECSNITFTQVNIYNIHGQLIMKSSVKQTNTLTIDISGLEAGILIMNTIDEKQNIISQSKIIKS